jgi:hypothetical protein
VRSGFGGGNADQDSVSINDTQLCRGVSNCCRPHLLDLLSYGLPSHLPSLAGRVKPSPWGRDSAENVVRDKWAGSYVLARHEHSPAW